MSTQFTPTPSAQMLPDGFPARRFYDLLSPYTPAFRAATRIELSSRMLGSQEWLPPGSGSHGGARAWQPLGPKNWWRRLWWLGGSGGRGGRISGRDWVERKRAGGIRLAIARALLLFKFREGRNEVGGDAALVGGGAIGQFRCLFLSEAKCSPLNAVYIYRSGEDGTEGCWCWDWWIGVCILALRGLLGSGSLRWLT